MRWRINKMGIPKEGAQKWVIKFAWFPTKALSRQPIFGTEEYDEYTIWLEKYECHYEYKKNVRVAHPKIHHYYMDKWVAKNNYILD